MIFGQAAIRKVEAHTQKLPWVFVANSNTMVSCFGPSKAEQILQQQLASQRAAYDKLRAQNQATEAKLQDACRQNELQQVLNSEMMQRADKQLQGIARLEHDLASERATTNTLRRAAEEEDARHAQAEQSLHQRCSELEARVQRLTTRVSDRDGTVKVLTTEVGAQASPGIGDGAGGHRRMAHRIRLASTRPLPPLAREALQRPAARLHVCECGWPGARPQGRARATEQGKGPLLQGALRAARCYGRSWGAASAHATSPPRARSV